MAAPLQFGCGFLGCVPGGVSVGGPLLVSGIGGFEALAFGGELGGEDGDTDSASSVALSTAIGGLPVGIGFSLGDEPELAADVGRGSGADALTLKDLRFEFAAVQVADDVGFVADLQGSEDGLTHGFEFGVAAVRLEGGNLVGVGDSGGFPVGGCYAGAARVIGAECGGRGGSKDAELASEPGFGAGGHLVAEGTGSVVEGSGELVGDRGSIGGRALRPGHVVLQVRQGKALQAVVQDAGDGPGAVHWRGGDPIDKGADVVAGELGGAEPLVQGRAGVLAVVPPGLGFGEPGLDLLVDAGVQGLPDGGGPQGEQVAGPAGPVLGLADLLGGGQIAVVAAHDAGEEQPRGWPDGRARVRVGRSCR